MSTVIVNFEKYKRDLMLFREEQKSRLLFEYQKEIEENEAQIRSLVIQINQLQANIDMNIRLIDQINKQ